MSARELALRYTIGMYGMTESFQDRLDDLETLIRDVLTYPELGEEPLFDRRFAFMPRRAVAARARKPHPGAAARFSEPDAALINLLSAAVGSNQSTMLRRTSMSADVARAWFGPGGARWGLSPRRQQAWFAWERGKRATGALI